MSKLNKTITTTIQTKITELRNQQVSWQQQQKQTDQMLYTLLDGCLDFYRLVKTDEDCLSAFKELLDFKWNKKTKISSMVVWMIFGRKFKQGYAYAAALEAAHKQNIGEKDNISMLHWLNDNGGVNGVIRASKADNKVPSQRDNAVHVGRNFEDYNIQSKKSPLTTETVNINHKGAKEVVLLCKFDDATNQFYVVWTSENAKIIDELYAEAGQCIMAQPQYEKAMAAAAKRQYQRQSIAKQKLGHSLNRLSAKVRSAAKLRKAA